ncbi:unnamed protein product [Rotaria magnacalcarata]|uniref:Uncharacterized protein n=1 Tax=Rotaria magnacalcarata TaxID=392030 RepID=A0A820EMH3_9BILA|nr:unnamed protein product [Rotaria magnacalcarata]CAF4251031.1 unnamed protein product [Rotaria magnacalcarata]
MFWQLGHLTLRLGMAALPRVALQEEDEGEEEQPNQVVENKNDNQQNSAKSDNSGTQSEQFVEDVSGSLDPLGSAPCILTYRVSPFKFGKLPQIKTNDHFVNSVINSGLQCFLP